MKKFNNTINRPQNYIPPTGASSFGKTWEPGEYMAIGIKWAAKDDQGHPILKVQKNGVMSARMRFIVKGQEKETGPYYMADLVQLNLLMKAFDKQVELLSIPDEKNSVEVRKFLEYAGEVINSSGNEVKFKMGENFIQWVDGLYIQADCNFILRVDKIISKNESDVLSWRQQDFGGGKLAHVIDVILEIVAGENGTETPYKGAQFKTQVPYGFKYYEEEDVIGFSVNEGGDDTPRGYAFRKFIHLYAPRLLTEGAEESYPEDVHNIVPWMEQYHDDILFQALIKNSPGKNGGMFYNVDWGKSSIVTGTPLGETLNIKPLEIEQEKIENKQEEVLVTPKIEVSLDNSDINIKAQKYLHQSLNELADGEIFADEGLSDIGKEFAQKYLKPLSEQGKIPQTQLAKVTFEEGQLILNALLSVVPEDKQVMIAEKIDLLNEALLGFDDKKSNGEFNFTEETPWA